VSRRKPARHRAQRLGPGRYLYRGRYIIRTTWEGDGPAGGTITRWELGTEDCYGAVVLDGVPSGGRTLREAKADVDQELAR